MNKVECKALILAPALKTSNYLEIASDLMKAGKLPTLKHVVRLGPEKTPGMLNFDDVAQAGGNAEKMKLAELAPRLRSTMPSTSSSPRAPPVTPRAPRSAITIS